MSAIIMSPAGCPFSGTLLDQHLLQERSMSTAGYLKARERIIVRYEIPEKRQLRITFWPDIFGQP